MPEHDSKEVREQFWELPISTLNEKEWELLCDNCGRCCLKKLQDEETDEIHWTRIVCRFHDQASKACTCYSERSLNVPECVNVKELTKESFNWMPTTCAYRLRLEEKPLFPWHPLIAGSTELMVQEGITIQGKVIQEDHVHPLGYDEHVIRWVES